MTLKQIKKALGNREERNSYVAGLVRQAEEAYYDLGSASGDYEKLYYRSVISRTLKLLEDII